MTKPGFPEFPIGQIKYDSVAQAQKDVLCVIAHNLGAIVERLDALIEQNARRKETA